MTISFPQSPVPCRHEFLFLLILDKNIEAKRQLREFLPVWGIAKKPSFRLKIGAFRGVVGMDDGSNRIEVLF
jgi:hypothetical protein